MEPLEIIAYCQRRLQLRQWSFWAFISLGSLLYIAALSLLLSDASRPAALALAVLGLCLLCSVLLRKKAFQGVSTMQAAVVLDELLSTKNRFTSLAELDAMAGDGRDREKCDVLESQLRGMVESNETIDIPDRFFSRRSKAFLFGSILPWLIIGVIAFNRETLNEAEAALIAEILEKHDDLPPELRESLKALERSLEENPLLDAQVAEALQSAQKDLEGALEAETESKSGGEKVVEEQDLKTPPAGGKEEATPTPTPAAAVSQEQQQQQQQEQQKQEQQQKEQQQQEKEKKEGQQDQQKQQQSQEQKKDADRKKDKEGEGKSEEKNKEGAGKDKQSSEQAQQQQGQKGGGQGSGAGQGEGKQQSGQGAGQAGQQQSDQQQSGKDQGQQQEQKGDKSRDNANSKGEGKKPSDDAGSNKGDGKEKSGSGGNKQDPNQQSQGGLNDTKKTLDQIQQQIQQKQDQQQKQEGKGDSKPQQKSEQQGKDEADKPSEGDKDKDSKSQNEKKTDKEKSEKPGDKKEGAKQDDKKESSETSDGNESGKSALPKPGEKSGQQPGNLPGTKEQERSRVSEVEVPPSDEELDSRYTGKEGQNVQNKKGAAPKTGLADIQLQKPELRKGTEEQYIPQEYEGILSEK